MTDNQNRKPRSFSVPSDAAKDVKKTAKPAPSKKKTTRKPRAVKEPLSVKFDNTDEDFFAAEERGELDNLVPPPDIGRPKKWLRLGSFVWAALLFLISAAIGLYIDQIVRDLMAQNIWLGRAALLATAIFALGVLIFIFNEIRAIWKMRSIAGLRASISDALEIKNDKQINQLSGALESHYQNNPNTAQARATLADNKDAVIDALDRYTMTETELLGPLDRQAKQMVMDAAKRVSVVTAVSPRAIVDIGYVLYENIRLIRKMSEHYGGYNGVLGTYALTKSVVAHLAVTGSIAIGDGIIQQLLGHGLAARLSARLGEGVINGLMTTRVGLSAIDVCRPAPFHALQKPKISDFASSLVKLSGADDAKNNAQ